MPQGAFRVADDVMSQLRKHSYVSVLAINDRPLDRAIKLHEIAAALDVTVSPLSIV